MHGAYNIIYVEGNFRRMRENLSTQCDEALQQLARSGDLLAEEELVRRYKVQLDYYAQALERLTGKTVKEKIIYSFTLNREISVL